MKEGAKMQSLGIKRLEAIHYYVRDLERSRRFYTELMDFAEIGTSDPALEARSHQRSAVFQAGAMRVVVSQPLGEGVGCRLGTGGDAQLTEDVADVDLGGALGDHELLGDRAVAGTLGEERQHLPLARRQRADLVRCSCGRRCGRLRRAHIRLGGLCLR